jgi:hypothetical protein
LHGYVRDVLPIAGGWFAAFAWFRGRFIPTWLVGTVLGVAIRSVVLGHYRLNVLAFLVVSLVFLGVTAGLMRIAVRRLGA